MYADTNIQYLHLSISGVRERELVAASEVVFICFIVSVAEKVNEISGNKPQFQCCRSH